MIKKITIVLFFCFSLMHSTWAQPGKSSEKIRALKVAYITEKLELSTSEAEKFWPIYNKFDISSHQLRREMKKKMRSFFNPESEMREVTNEEAKDLISSKLKMDKKLLQLEEQFLKDVEKIISPQKMLKLQIAEMEFGRKLMRRYRGSGKKE